MPYGSGRTNKDASNVKEITRKGTHSFPRLNVFHFERSLLESEYHKDRELSLVLDLEPKPTFMRNKLFIQSNNCRTLVSSPSWCCL